MKKKPTPKKTASKGKKPQIKTKAKETKLAETPHTPEAGIAQDNELPIPTSSGKAPPLKKGAEIKYDKDAPYRFIGNRSFPFPTPLELANLAASFILIGKQHSDAVEAASDLLELSASKIERLKFEKEKWIKGEIHYTFRAGLREIFGSERFERASAKLQNYLFELSTNNPPDFPSPEEHRAWVYRRLQNYEINGFTGDEVEVIKEILARQKKNL